MRDEEFEWDDDKARANLVDHKIDFNDARLVFADFGLVEDEDDTMDYSENRYRAVGMANARLITVFYTLRDGRIRIISARGATRKEQRTYARQNPPS